MMPSEDQSVSEEGLVAAEMSRWAGENGDKAVFTKDERLYEEPQLTGDRQIKQSLTTFCCALSLTL